MQSEHPKWYRELHATNIRKSREILKGGGREFLEVRISYPATTRHNAATPKHTTNPMLTGIAVANAAHFTLPVSL